jgi:hypothetical protein
LIASGPPRQFAADVLAGARPLPEVPRELASLLLKAAGAPAVITAWGDSPGELPDVALLAFTTTTPRSAKLPAVAMVLSGPGVFLRGAAMPLRAHPEALTPQAAATLLRGLPDHAIVYISAEAGVPVEQLVAALRSVPDRFEVALAVALPKGTRLPAPAARGSELLCPDGLPEPAADAVEGSLDAATLRQVLAPLRDAGLSCALGVGGLALQGGRLEIGLRISPDGRARELCMVGDTIGEPVLRRCVIEAARSLQFPAPSPAGFVDVHLPLELTLEGPTAQRALCDSINAKASL